METMTTIEKVERTDSGAFKITLLGDIVAGTRDAEIGALAERLAQDPGANGVALKLDKLPGGKLLIKTMQEVLPPAELGGSEEPAPVVGEATPEPTGELAHDEEETHAETTAVGTPVTLTEEQYDALSDDEKAAYYKVPEMSPPQDARYLLKEDGEMETKPEKVVVDIGAYSNEALLAEVARRMG